MIRGDGMMFEKTYAYGRMNAFRLALADDEALNRSRLYLEMSGIRTSTHSSPPRPPLVGR